MKLALLGIAGGAAFLGWLVKKLVTDDDESARHQRWLDDYERRQNGSGMDGSAWAWHPFVDREIGRIPSGKASRN